MSYQLKSFLLVFVFFPVITLFTADIIVFTIFHFYSIYDLTIVATVISLLSGFYLGKRHAKKSYYDIPDSFVPRYWMLLAPMVLILTYRILTTEEPSFYADRTAILFALCYVPLVLSFIANVPPEKKLANMRWRWSTCVFIAVLFASLFWQAKLDFDNTLLNDQYYAGATILDEVIVKRYWPWEERNRLTKLDTPASLLLSEDFPVIDGATSFVPVYSAVVNEIYQVDDKKDLQNYVTCSRTSEAYNRLIRNEVDMIFVFQPSDEQLAVAKEAGIELSLTPIAKEAFVFFVNRGNLVHNLSLEQIQDIYLKKITNWRQVGGADKRILPFQRPRNSGSQTAMLKDVMKDKELPPPLQAEYSALMGGMYRDIAIYRDEEEAIGYSFRFYAQVMVKYRNPYSSGSWPHDFPPDPDSEPVKLLSVNDIAPTEDNIRNGSYPFTQDVFVVTAGTSNPRVRELINWLLSPQGQELIEKVGYVGLR